MKGKLFTFLKYSDKLVLLPAFCTLIFLVLIVGTFIILYQQLPPKLPLFYSLPWGQSQLVNKEQFIILPVILVLMGLLNTFLAFQLHPLQLVLKRILTLSLILINLIVFVATMKIMFLFV